MIISVDKLKQYVTTDKTDEVLEAMLQALELSIRKYTNNNFQKIGFRVAVGVADGVFYTNAPIPFKEGETVQISDSVLNDGIYTIATIDNDKGTFTVNEDIVDDTNMLVTKVEYPADVKMGVANMMQWELEHRDKVGVQSETISRHSVTYFNMDGDNSILGYPKSLIGFLKPYKKARF